MASFLKKGGLFQVLKGYNTWRLSLQEILTLINIEKSKHGELKPWELIGGPLLRSGVPTIDVLAGSVIMLIDYAPLNFRDWPNAYALSWIVNGVVASDVINDTASWNFHLEERT